MRSGRIRSDDPPVPQNIRSDRTDKAKFAQSSIPFLVSVALIAAVNVILVSVASISLLDTSKETLTRSRSHNSPLEDKVIGGVVSHMDSGASPDPTQIKSSSAGNADNISASASIPPYSGMLTEETLAVPSLKPTSNREASATAVETANGSTRAPSTDATPPPELNPSQEVRAPPASIAESATAVETANSSTRGPSADGTPPPELNPSEEVRAPPASIANAANPTQDASGATMPIPAISHEQRDQVFQDSEMQRHHANLDEGSVAVAPEIDFPPKTQINGSMRFYGSSAEPESKPLARHETSGGRRPSSSTANKLNHAELRRLLRGEGVLR
jgi:hypothetical protein